MGIAAIVEVGKIPTHIQDIAHQHQGIHLAVLDACASQGRPGCAIPPGDIFCFDRTSPVELTAYINIAAIDQYSVYITIQTISSRSTLIE